MKKWRYLALVPLVFGIMVGCDSGSDSSDGDYDSYVFINDTDDHITVWRDGGEEWEGDDSFDLNSKGEERTVVLKEKGSIGYRWLNNDSGEIDIDSSGNTIIFKEK